ncbi:metal ABC transporter substrate-binding protein [Synechococcus sp. RC10B2]|uniref:metal ABC transporter solute-binding protein, Zn/Mn family n=1 Tax=Synechococcus sp. RC10B2 TaxID=2964530 RepID=UPI0039C5AE31
MYAATLAVVADWARALELPVALLQPRSADAHETPLNVRMVRRALQAKAVLAVGGGLEGYLPALQRATQGKTPIRTLLDHLRPKPDDLHIWLDLGYTRQSCEQILRWAAQDGLLGLAQRQAWRRTELLFRQLAVRMREARTTLQGKAYLAVHDAYRPLTQQLGMRSLGSLQPDHERPPSLQAFRDAIARARRARVAMVLCADESPLGATAARLLQVPLVLADTLEMPDPQRDYFTRMVGLIDALQRAI